MNIKRLGKILLFPHPIIAGGLFPLALGMMLCCVLMLPENHPMTIFSYALSFYGLMIFCLRIPAMLRAARRIRQENRYYLRYQSDVQLRMNISLYGAFSMNAAYALLQLGLGIRHHSAWFYAMAGYYLMLALMRLSLSRYTHRFAPGERKRLEWQRYRLCSVCLMAISLALTFFTAQFILRIRDFRHHEITAIAMAAYTFCSLTLAIVNLIRYRKYGSPVYSAAKAISLVSALVSLLTLENALLSTFGKEEGEAFRQIILACSGAAVIGIILAIALRMLLHGSREIRKMAETE